MKLIRWIILILLIGGGWWTFQTGRSLYNDYHAQSRLPQLVKIEKGSSLQQIARQLADNQVISNPDLFRWVARFREVDTKLKAGRYQFAVQPLLYCGSPHQH